MNVEENRFAQGEELEVLLSIYGDRCQSFPEKQQCEVQVSPSGAESEELWDADNCLHLRVHMPDSYPSTSAPVAEVDAKWLSALARGRLWEGLQAVADENRGQVVVFNWVEWLKEQEWVWQEARQWLKDSSPGGKGPSTISRDCTALPKEARMVLTGGQLNGLESEGILRGRPPEGSAAKALIRTGRNRLQGEPVGGLDEERSLRELDELLGIFHGEPFTERKSTFQAHVAAVETTSQVEGVMEALLSNRKVAGATHNIMAFRIHDPLLATVVQDYDDDGESAAGGRLLHLLQIVDAKNVVVVVSRWFGGILLGPDRFKHINNAARSLLDSCGFIGPPGKVKGKKR